MYHIIIIFTAALSVYAQQKKNDDNICHSSDGSVVYTNYGCIRGIVTDQGRKFTKIPYASPPTPENDLRFRNPVPPQKWFPHVLNTTSTAPACMQTCFDGDISCHTTDNVSMSEDCLYLNVYTSLDVINSELTDPLPVLLFIHGGNYYFGWSGSTLFNGLNFAYLNKAIVVTINYRLGSFGFFYDPAHGIKGNYGYFDQQFALQWAYENIEYFGGDKNNIILFGESAGAQSVATLLMNKTNHMYSGAIMESNPWGLPFRTINSWDRISPKYVKAAKCSDKLSKNIGNCMRNAETTANMLLEAQISVGNESLTDCIKSNKSIKSIKCYWVHLFEPWTPTFQTENVLPQTHPLHAFQNGDYNKNVPIIIGNNQNEGILFIYELVAGIHNNSFAYPLYKWQYELLIISIMGKYYGNQIINEYKSYEPKGFRADYRNLLSMILTEFWFVCPARNASLEISKNSNANVWLYQYNFHYNDTEILLGDCPKCVEEDIVCHTDELALVFQPNGFVFNQNEINLSDKIQEYWTNLARFNSPNDGKSGWLKEWFYDIIGRKSIRYWSNFEEGKFKQKAMIFNADGTFKTKTYNGNDHNCKFWDNLGYPELNWQIVNDSSNIKSDGNHQSEFNNFFTTYYA